MDSKPNEEYLQEKFAEYQMLEQQIKVVQSHLETLQQKVSELDGVIKALDDFENVKKGKSVLVPLSQGIFFKAKIEKTDVFLVNIGSNVVVEKSLSDLKAMLLTQGQELEDYKEKFEAEFGKMVSSFELIESELKDLIKE